LKQIFRTGFGFDVHAFVEGRKLIIGGVQIPSGKGLIGHSDADVLLHAICDALLGALALGDIGTHFPNTDAKWKDSDSTILLKHSYNLVKKNGYVLSNIDCVLAMESPKIAPYVEQIKNRIAEILESDINQISVKATTTEKLGFIGRTEGVASFATVLLMQKDFNV
jgi:2-C-methyl-D-erythritol 2,4-cyclodiphosphate synthase